MGVVTQAVEFRGGSAVMAGGDAGDVVESRDLEEPRPHTSLVRTDNLALVAESASIHYRGNISVWRWRTRSSRHRGRFPSRWTCAESSGSDPVRYWNGRKMTTGSLSVVRPASVPWISIRHCSGRGSRKRTVSEI